MELRLVTEKREQERKEYMHMQEQLGELNIKNRQLSSNLESLKIETNVLFLWILEKQKAEKYFFWQRRSAIFHSDTREYCIIFPAKK